MGRIRKTMRWTFSFGGTGAGSPIRAESSAEQAARRTHELLEEQNALLQQIAPRQQPPEVDSRALLDSALADMRMRENRTPGSEQAEMRPQNPGAP